MIARTKQFNNLSCFTDSTLTISLIKTEDITFHRYAVVIKSIRNLLKLIPNVTITHILREGNSVADYLAKKGAQCACNLKILDSPLPEIKHLLLGDALEVQHMRL
ncbi:Ribonuclease H domain [Sesbania bispinosa]|nr:Ribonuclease H domain [Sesbania bispinosa]